MGRAKNFFFDRAVEQAHSTQAHHGSVAQKKRGFEQTPSA
jgi:hypothetical protein